MPQNFIACDREQSFLLPPSLLEWVPEDHLVWTILGAVDELDLTGVYRVYRPDGHGRPAYEPGMMGLRYFCIRIRRGSSRRGRSSASVRRMWRSW
jgi:transposase